MKTPLESESKNKVYHLQVKTLFGNLRQVVTAVLILPSMVSLILNQNIVWVWHSLFLGIGLLICWRTSSIGKRYLLDSNEQAAKGVVRQWTIQTLFFASMWTVLCWIPGLVQDMNILIIGIVITGTTSGNLLLNATFPKVGMAYMLVVLSALSFKLASLSVGTYWPIIVMLALYAALVTKIQLRMYEFFMETFQLMSDLEVANKARKRSEKVAIATSRLAAQAEMTASLTHEIVNPLTIIK
ncbi:MAG: hypothetical protein AAF203_00415, partial [Pseudomonadota bacterium]